MRTGLRMTHFWNRLFLAIFVLPSLASADLTVTTERTPEGTLMIYRMQVTPAAEPNPVFRYRFTKQPHRTIPGNAITHYLRSFGENSLEGGWKLARDQFGDDVETWYGQEVALSELPLEKVREASGYFDSYVDGHLRRATRCRFVDWGLAEEELAGMEMIGFLLPSVQQTRSISRMLALRTRLCIAEGRYDDAIEHIRMNYQLGQDVSKMKFLISGLVGIAEVGIAHGNMVELIAAPDSPNLYWALAELPRPIIDLRDATRLELSFADRITPGLVGIETAEHTHDEWNRLLKQTQRDISSMMGVLQGGQGSNPSSEWMTTALSIASYPASKANLIAQGMPADKVESMAIGQVLLLDLVGEYQRIANLMERALYVPPHQAKDLLSESDSQLRAGEQNRTMGAMMAGMMIPAIQQVQSAQIRIEWQRNALQVIEAVRMHLAKTGELPASLEEITVVPLPTNPFTGQAYEYSCDGTTAVLDLPFGEATGIAQRFEITIAK